ncbi:hypothetical protein FRC18_005499 [Serendipita sp. 400]|nr:hypothetical protein FRC18_005499 [Serendipita sp. 400]
MGGGGFGSGETSLAPSGPTTSPTGGGSHPRGSGPTAGLVIGVLFLILLGLFVLGVLSAATHSFWAGVRSRLAGVQFRRPSLLPFQRPQWRQRTGLPSSSRKATLMSSVATGTTIAGIALTYDPEDPRKGKRIVPLPYTPTISIDEQKSTTEMEGRRERGLGGRARYGNRLALWASTPGSGSDPAPGPSPTLWTPTYTSRPLPSPHSSVDSVRADPEDELSQSSTTKAVLIASKVNGAGRKQSEDSFVSQATLVNPSSPTSVLPRTLYPRSQSMRQPNIGEKKPNPRHYSLDQMTLETSREPNVTRSASLSDAPVSGRPNDRTMTEKKKQNTTSSSCSTTVGWSGADPAKPPPSSFSEWGARNPYLHLNRHNSMPHRSTERALQLSSSSVLRIKTTSTTFRMGGNPQQTPQWTVMDRVENKKGSGDSVLSSSVGGSSTPSSTPPSSSPSPTATSSSSPSSSPSSSSILHGSRHLPRPLRQHSIGVVQVAKDEATLPYLTRSSTTVVHTMSSPPETEAVLPLSSPPPKVN